MTSINAGGAFYRVQNSLNQNSEKVSMSMQRLASGKQNISPGDATVQRPLHMVRWLRRLASRLV